MQKSFIFILSLSLLPIIGAAQKTFKKGFSAGKQKVVLMMDKSSVDITGYAGNEVEISTDSEYTVRPLPDRAKGLKPLHNGASDNTGIGLDVQESGGVVTIKKAVGRNMTFKIKIPAGADLTYEQNDWQHNALTIKDLTGEVEVKGRGTTINIENVTGPIVANTTNGSIDVVFTKVNQSKPTHISAINGHVDITLPSDTKTNIEMSATNGESFTDFDIKYDENVGFSMGNRTQVAGTINGGGVELSLNSINNNVYLRKK
jgi:hypothetical protein